MTLKDGKYELTNRHGVPFSFPQGVDTPGSLQITEEGIMINGTAIDNETKAALKTALELDNTIQVINGTLSIDGEMLTGTEQAAFLAGVGASKYASKTANRPKTLYSSFVDSTVVDPAPPTISQATATSTSISSGVLWPAVISGAMNPVFECIGPGVASWASVPTHLTPNGLSITSHLTFRFWTDSSVVELRLLNYNTQFNVRVDGRLIQQAKFSFSSAGSTQMLKMVFPTAKPRLIEVSGFNMPFGGVYTTPNGSIWAAPLYTPLAYVLGDSYTQGSGADSVDQTWIATAARLLGCAVTTDGLGGSGYRTASPNSPVERLNAKVPLLRAVPDVVAIALGYNDSASSQSAIGIACAATIAAAKSVAPSSRIVVYGPFTPLGDTTNLTNTDETIRAAALAAGVAFISLRGIVSSANSSIYTGGDNVHPSAVGHYYIGSRVASLSIPAWFE